MTAVIKRCDQEIDNVSTNIDDSKGYFNDVATNVKDLKNKLTKKMSKGESFCSRLIIFCLSFFLGHPVF